MKIVPVTAKKQTKDTSIVPDISELMSVLLLLVEDAYDALAPHTSRAGLLRDKATIQRRCKCEGLVFLTERLPELGKSFLTYIETGSSDFAGYHTRDQLPVFLRGLFVCYERGYKRVTAFKAIHQITSLCKKLRGDYDERKLAEQYNSFCEVDEELASVDNLVEEDTDQVLKLARFFCNEHFKILDPETAPGFIGRPGPGATEDQCPRPMRYEPQRLYRVHDDVMPYAQWWYPLLCDVNHRARHYKRLMKYSSHQPIARLKYVPKTAGKARGICIERNESQFLQQTLAAGILRHINSSSLSSYIQIHNQNLNANLALESSWTQDWATIDMSDASDRIARSLVKYIFQDTLLVDYLMSVSTSVIMPDKSLEPFLAEIGAPPVVIARKFAPMGSGLCFPIMTLIHYYLIKAMICRIHQTTPEEAGKVYVYGDDIVIQSKYASTVFEQLPKYGMKLNRTKSFVASKFRESCGIHAYNGVDVTPVYLKYTTKTDQPGHLHSVAINEKDLRDRGWKLAADHLESKLLSLGLKRVPKGTGLYGLQRESYECGYPFKLRWNGCYQRWEWKAPTLASRTVTSAVSTQTGALMRYWALACEKAAEVEEVPLDSVTHIKWRWLPAPVR